MSLNTGSARRKGIAAAIFILLLLTLLLLTSIAAYSVLCRQKLDQAGKELTITAERTSAFLDRAVTLTDATADAVNIMMESHVPTDTLRGFLEEQTDLYHGELNSNVKNIYGLFNGVYLDGSRWTPPADFEPTDRPWYLAAKSSPDQAVLVSPYIDAVNQETIIAVSKRLKDTASVLSVDIKLDEIATYAVDLLDGRDGYALIVDPSGCIVSSSDPMEIGRNYLWDAAADPDNLGEIIAAALRSPETYDTLILGQRHTVLSQRLETGGTVILALDVHALYGNSVNTLIVSITVLLLLIGLVIFFGFRLLHLFRQRREEDAQRLQAAEAATRELRYDNAIINCIAGVYDYVCLVGINTNSIRNYRVSGLFSRYIRSDTPMLDPWEFDRVLRQLVPDTEFDAFRRLADRDTIMNKLNEEKECSFLCTLMDGDTPMPYRFKFVRPEEFSSHVVIGIRCIADELEEQKNTDLGRPLTAAEHD